MDEKEKWYEQPWENPWNKYKDNWAKCLCKEKCFGKCKHLNTWHPSKPYAETPTPILTVEEAVQVYRNTKAVTKQVAEDLQQTKELLAKLQLDHIAALNEETRAKATLDRAFEEEAKDA